MANCNGYLLCRHTEARERSPHSILAYLSDLRQFIARFPEHTCEPSTSEAITEYDGRDWRDHLAATMKPTTTNRRLTAPSTLYC